MAILDPGQRFPHLSAALHQGLGVSEAQFTYSGPGGRVYVLWGRKKRDTGIIKTGVDFNNGGGLENGPEAFGYAAIDLPPTPEPTEMVIPIPLPGQSVGARSTNYAALPLDPTAHKGDWSDTFVWMSTDRTAAEDRFLKRMIAYGEDDPLFGKGMKEGIIDTDAEVVKVGVAASGTFWIQPINIPPATEKLSAQWNGKSQSGWSNGVWTDETGLDPLWMPLLVWDGQRYVPRTPRRFRFDGQEREGLITLFTININTGEQRTYGPYPMVAEVGGITQIDVQTGWSSFRPL